MVEGDRHVGAAGVLHRRGGRAAVAGRAAWLVALRGEVSPSQSGSSRPLLPARFSSLNRWFGIGQGRPCFVEACARGAPRCLRGASQRPFRQWLATRYLARASRCCHGGAG